MRKPKLLTVILNWRTPDMTLSATRAALREMEGIDGQVIVVDNDSRDGSFEKLHEVCAQNGWAGEGRVRVVQSGRNGGFGAGNNFGIRAGLAERDDFDLIYILNSDAFPDPGAIRSLISYLQATPQAGLAGSYIHGPDGETHQTAFRFPSVAGEFEEAACTGPISRLLRRWIVSLPTPQANQRVDWLAGASLMIRREALKDFGLFDEGFFLYFEETDLCRRALRAGWETHYVRDSAVTHIGSASTQMKTWQRTPEYWFDSRQRYYAKAGGPMLVLAAGLAQVLGSAIYRLRIVLNNKPQRDPNWFLLDFCRHAIRTAWRNAAPGKPKSVNAEPKILSRRPT